MEVAQWSRLSFLQLPRRIRRILLMGAPVLAMLAVVGVAGWKWLTRNGQKGVHGTGTAKHESAVSVARGGKSEAATVVESSSEEQRRPERKSTLFEVHPGNRNVPATGTLCHLTLQFCSEHCKLFSPSSLLSSSPSSPHLPPLHPPSSPLLPPLLISLLSLLPSSLFSLLSLLPSPLFSLLSLLPSPLFSLLS